MNFWNNFTKDNLIAAHRGYRAIRAENTLIAFKEALGRCDFLELDVGFTKDCIPIVIHDDTLLRTTNVKDNINFQEPYNVIDYNYSQLKELDFSSWFINSDPFGTIKSKKVDINELKKVPIQRVLRLKEVLTFAKKYNMPINIELKDMKNREFDKIAVKEVLNLVQELKVDSLILFSSFNHKYLQELYNVASHIPTAALFEDKFDGDLVQYLKDLNVSAYHCHIDIFNDSELKILKENNFKVAVYTVNSKEEKERLFRLGVNAIFTDFL